MRKANREIKRMEDLLDVIERCDVCRVAFTTDDVPYIVPVNFGYSCNMGVLKLYFHCAVEGRKLDLLAQNSRVGFEMDTAHKLTAADTPCGYSMNFESIIGAGTLRIVDDRDGRLQGLTHLMNHYGGTAPYEFDERALLITTVLELEVERMTGKRLQK